MTYNIDEGPCKGRTKVGSLPLGTLQETAQHDPAASSKTMPSGIVLIFG